MTDVERPPASQQQPQRPYLPDGLRRDFVRELLKHGLPTDATLDDLIRHHVGNAGLTSVFNLMAQIEGLCADADSEGVETVPVGALLRVVRGD